MLPQRYIHFYNIHHTLLTSYEQPLVPALGSGVMFKITQAHGHQFGFQPAQQILRDLLSMHNKQGIVKINPQ